jgi:hypothetical protein
MPEADKSTYIDKPRPIPYIFISDTTLTLSGRNSAVECQLPKLDVTGSIPVARSKPNEKRLSFLHIRKCGGSRGCLLRISGLSS